MFGLYLMFNRNCSDALEVYTEAFNAQVKEKQTFKEVIKSNPNFPLAKEDEDLIIYSKIKIGNMQVICVDSSERSLAGFNTYIFVKEEEDVVRKAWSILKQDGVIYTELDATTFAALHGSLRDKFGINWMFTVPKPKVVSAKTEQIKLKLPTSKSKSEQFNIVKEKQSVANPVKDDLPIKWE